MWVEGWKPECIAFRYYNILQMFKSRHEVPLKWHTELMRNSKATFSDDQVSAFEVNNLGLDLSKPWKV